MKKYINFNNFGIFCLACICVTIFTSATTWSAPMTTRQCYADVIMVDGHKYVIATTGASNSPGVSIVHAASCRCGK